MKRIMVWRRRMRGGRKGQSMTEFALTLPLLLMLFVFALDFGRVFLGWVNLNNTVRVAANFAANNPNAWANNDQDAKDEYLRLIQADTTGINCEMPGTVPEPTFPSGKDLGQPALVQITCDFTFITPFVGSFLGNPLPVSASAAFPIRNGAILGVPVATTTVTTTTTTTTTTPSPTPTPVASPTPVPDCIVPDLRGTSTANAQAAWSAAGFTTNVIFNPLVPPDYIIDKQNPNDGLSRPCTTTTIEVKP